MPQMWRGEHYIHHRTLPLALRLLSPPLSIPAVFPAFSTLAFRPFSAFIPLCHQTPPLPSPPPLSLPRCLARAWPHFRPGPLAPMAAWAMSLGCGGSWGMACSSACLFPVTGVRAQPAQAVVGARSPKGKALVLWGSPTSPALLAALLFSLRLGRLKVGDRARFPRPAGTSIEAGLRAPWLPWLRMGRGWRPPAAGRTGVPPHWLNGVSRNSPSSA